MEKRIQLDRIDPAAFKAVLGLESYLANSGLNPRHKHLVKIRASLINGCAYCIDMHTREALKDGEDPRRLHLISAWRETDRFSDEEKVLFALTEETTLIHKKGLTSKTYADALTYFGEAGVAQILMAVVAINAWNRIAIATHKPIPG